MKGTRHDVTAFDGGVELTNVEDTHYDCVFETTEELQAFIDKLIGAGKKAFGPKEEEY